MSKTFETMIAVLIVAAAAVALGVAVFRSGAAEETARTSKDAPQATEATQTTPLQSAESPVSATKASPTSYTLSTYSTKFGDIKRITCSTFSFDYPDGWSITTEDYDQQNNALADEYVVLANARGVKMTFTRWSTSQIGGSGRNMTRYQVSKAGSSSFVPGYAGGTDTDFSYLGSFMTARVEITGEMQMETESDYTPVSGSCCYAVVPASCQGTHESVGRTGFEEIFGFPYPNLCSFIAEAPDGKFTQSETADVIAILSSFRVQ